MCVCVFIRNSDIDFLWNFINPNPLIIMLTTTVSIANTVLAKKTAGFVLELNVSIFQQYPIN